MEREGGERLEEGQSEEGYQKPRPRARRTKRLTISAWNWVVEQAVSIKGCIALIFLALTLVIVILVVTHPNFEKVKTAARAYIASEESRNGYAGFRPPANWTCERIDLPESAAWFWKNYVLPRKPVIIEGGLEKLRWQTSKWTVDYLDKKVGDLTVRFEKKTSSDPRFGRVGDERADFRWFLRNVFAPETNSKPDPRVGPSSNYYLNLQDPVPGTIMQEPLLTLSSDFTVPYFFTTTELTNINLWMGNADDSSGGRSALHHDAGDNVYALVEGTKLAHLWAPSDAFNLYTMGVIDNIAANGKITYLPHGSPHFSQLEDPDDGDRTAFPKFGLATRVECAFGKGDMLYLPVGWFHELHSFGRTMAINFWAKEPDNGEVLRTRDEQSRKAAA